MSACQDCHSHFCNGDCVKSDDEWQAMIDERDTEIERLRAELAEANEKRTELREAVRTMGPELVRLRVALERIAGDDSVPEHALEIGGIL